MAARWVTKALIKAAALTAGSERRSSLENPQVPLSYPAEWLLDIFNGGRTDSGIRVSEMTALQVGTIYACVNIISNGFAALPLGVYEKFLTKVGRLGKKKAETHSLWDLLSSEPNVEMTTFTWLKTMMIHALLWGNAYTEIQRDGANRIIGLWPRNPARTRPIRCLQPITREGTLFPAGTLFYETTETLMDNENPSMAGNPDSIQIGVRRLILAEDMLHVPGMSLDARVGQSTVWLVRQAIGLSLATEKFGAKFFGNGARPAGILTMPNAMQAIAIENLRRSWAEAHGGENAFKVAVLEAGVKFEKIAATPNEGQFLETRKYQREEICSIFNVPQHMVAAADTSGKSNTEQNSIEFVQYCLRPWITAFQMELNRKLFPNMGRSANKFFPMFDTRHLLYPDAESRSKFYAAGRQWTFLTMNDILEWEGMNPDETGIGDQYLVPQNMTNAKALMPGGALDGKKEVPPAPVVPPAAPAGKGKPKPKPGKRDEGPLFDDATDDETETAVTAAE